MVKEFKIWLFKVVFPEVYHLVWRHAYGVIEEWDSAATDEQRNFFNGQRMMCLNIMERIRGEPISTDPKTRRETRAAEREHCD